MIVYFLALIVYGFILTAILGLFAAWVDRKVTARVQYRVGPPLFQPVLDILKLFAKETLIPRNAHKVSFLTAPAIGLGSVIAASTILWVNNLSAGKSFLGDIIVVIYFLVIPSLSIIMGGFASGNPLASLGASREMKLILAYELPFILAICVPIIKSGFSIRLGDILSHQAEFGANAASFSGFLAVAVIIMCIQAKLGLVPFDIPEAETEIVSGPIIEYSGAPLALYRLMKNMLLFVLPFFAIILFFNGIGTNRLELIAGAGKYVGIVALITVIRNTNPRLRIDQAVKFFWGPMTIIAVIAVFLALKGL